MANSIKVSPINLNRDLIKRYDYLFPLTKRTFLERALTLALSSPDFLIRFILMNYLER